MRKKLLVTMSLLFIAGVLLSGCSTPEGEYEKSRQYIQLAVTTIMVENGGWMPTHGEIIIMLEECECHVSIPPYPQGGWTHGGYALDFCYLLEYWDMCGKGRQYHCFPNERTPFQVPICCYGQSGEEGTNFYSGNCTNPYNGHYVWLVDDVGNVCSVCVGDDCWANNESGYQGVWP